MKNKSESKPESKYDLIYDYPYIRFGESAGYEFLQAMTEPADIEAAGKKLERKLCPYGDVLKANQIDVALAVRYVLNLPFHTDNPELRKKTRELIANFVKHSAEQNKGKVIGKEIIKLLLEYKTR